MLLIDGVKYNEWTDLRETEDLEPMIQEHAKYIFGENALYIDRKQKLRSLAGTGSIPDAYVISLGGDLPHWHIVEIELSYKDPSRHLVTQINDFINGMKNSRNEIVSAINHWIKSDDIRATEFKRRSQCEDIHEFLSDLIKKDPILTIIIEKNTEKLKEAIQIFEERYKTEIVEFRTFRREDAETVHAHLFEPLVKEERPMPISTSEPSEHRIRAPVARLPLGNDASIEVILSRGVTWRRYHLIYFGTRNRPFFPGYKIPFQMETDEGNITTWVASTTKGGKRGGTEKVGDAEAGMYIQRNMKPWFDAHPELKAGDRLLITVIEPMKKYRLEIVK